MAVQLTELPKQEAKERVTLAHKKVLVTGGAGYIGSVVVDQLIDAGCEVFVVDNLTGGHREAVHEKAHFLEADISDEATMAAYLQNNEIDAVIHLAACIDAGESVTEPEKYFTNNTEGTIALLNAMKKTGVKYMVFSSTAAVYGDPMRTPIDESDSLFPINPYGESKLRAERAIQKRANEDGLRVVIFRYFNAAGATQRRGELHKPESHLIPLAIDAAEGKRQLTLFGDGANIRDYVHVSDLATAHLLALEKLFDEDMTEPLIYNLGNGNGYSNLDVIQAVTDATRRDVPFERAFPRVGDPLFLVASADKARRELGWEPQHTELLDIISSAVEWRRLHPEGYRRTDGLESTR